MTRFNTALLSVAACLLILVPLMGCTPAQLAGPQSAANATVLDEKVAVSVELAFKAARIAAETAVDAGIVAPSGAVKLQAAREKAYTAVKLVRQAYAAGNAATYADAAVKAHSAITDLLVLIGR